MAVTATWSPPRPGATRCRAPTPAPMATKATKATARSQSSRRGEAPPPQQALDLGPARRCAHDTRSIGGGTQAPLSSSLAGQ